jgi:hypothetical protein
MCAEKQPDPEQGQPVVRHPLSELANFRVSLQPKVKTNIQAHILDFSVTTDSVVATATIRTDATTRRIVVDWGDGKTDFLNARPGVHLPGSRPQEPLPPGTFRFHHAYAEPEDKKPFDFFVLVRVEDANGPDFRIRKITLTPRYRVTNFRTSVRLEDQCDSIFESSNEFDITQLIDGVPVRQWRWEPSNNFFPSPSFRLEGSLVSRELTLADPFVNVTLELIEDDPLFDDHHTVNQSLHASQSSERFDVAASGKCKVVAQWDRDVQLIVPLPSQGGSTTLEV